MRMVTIPDEMSTIVGELKRCRENYDVVITSGGVGPTHDDITLEAVAQACERPLELNSTLEGFIRNVFKERTTPDHLRMATIPKGCELIDVGPSTWPIVSLDGLYVLPGVPQIFRRKFDAILERFRVGAWWLRSVYLNAEEGIIARTLHELEANFEVNVGSYPVWNDADYRVRITIEAREPHPVNQAVTHLLKNIPAQQVVRYDEPLTGTEPSESA